MMPTEQRCPKCGETFVGSDAIGDVCPQCDLEVRGSEMGHFTICPTCGASGRVCVDSKKSK